MRNTGHATTATHFPTRKSQRAQRGGLAQRAPGPEASVARDRSGLRNGLIVVLVVCTTFWGAVAAVIVHLLR